MNTSTAFLEQELSDYLPEDDHFCIETHGYWLPEHKEAFAVYSPATKLIDALEKQFGEGPGLCSMLNIS